MSPSEFRPRRICLRKPSHRAPNTASDRRTVRHDIAPSAGGEPLWSGPRPGASDDEGA
ncbi:hypothetical protein [Mycobacterium sp. E2479]|uniref:hypothetical protein n=1 Tax=Mycobacterium sp. E2479 TaxID=1834134 RepID=UPI0018D420E1|nr:hypothetical protein [Mycobacterium sp. E2479]